VSPSPPETSSALSHADAVLGRCVQTLNRMKAMGLAPKRIGARADASTSSGQSLEQIRADLGDCRRCGLCRSRRRIVFGAGAGDARLVFVGEGPGEEEDRRGEPFVGAAGELLTRIIEAIQLTRDQVYICNVIKCRPPENRTPNPDEIATCRPFLESQLAAIRPAFICALGAVSAQTLSGTSQPISAMRGRFFNACGAQVMPTFHPAYLLRHPARKRDVWEDMKALMAAMGRAPDSGR